MSLKHNQKPFKLAIIGFGTVGEGVYWTLQHKAEKITRLLGRPLSIPLVLVKDTKHREIIRDTKVTNDFEDLLKEKHLDVVVEASPDATTAYP
ncbi:hypothetical protein, partial [Pseudomonas sp. 2822-17]|uniref:hypothetical protein n=1 Tax=Pseudomonas sp. 2822-17 TaxID=1712678 RepID=UPI002114F85B